jgi:hypothetical protein
MGIQAKKPQNINIPFIYIEPFSQMNCMIFTRGMRCMFTKKTGQKTSSTGFCAIVLFTTLMNHAKLRLQAFSLVIKLTRHFMSLRMKATTLSVKDHIISIIELTANLWQLVMLTSATSTSTPLTLFMIQTLCS